MVVLFVYVSFRLLELSFLVVAIRYPLLSFRVLEVSYFDFLPLFLFTTPANYVTVVNCFLEVD